MRSPLRGRSGNGWERPGRWPNRGAAGPTGNSYGDAAGHCCFAVSGPVERCLTIETAAADREANMWVFARTALGFLEKTVRAHG